MVEDKRKLERRLAGRKSKINGRHFEFLIERACQQYERQGMAYIQKTPEPMRMIRPTRQKGTVMAVFEKKAQPDFTGTLQNGQSIVFEAKHTESTRMEFSRIEPHQEADLNKHHKLGAACFILVSFSVKDFYMIPWADWQKMKETIGKKSLNEKDLESYTVSVDEGIINFLKQ